ncbi:hypothetical protein [Bradyrhizobium canariense]|uniref:Uncharacterized protein n=1 Tax=Bradyrhizobium canariense TaxID=255045 RepID=A0A1H1R5Z4_9BRAD|nr:hypothetical protein [Bradyrhizobium canariense]SDS31234.1 hypothetical protein SAMN05444158_1665 [Bradyrhizobium canariense]
MAAKHTNGTPGKGLAGRISEAWSLAVPALIWSSHGGLAERNPSLWLAYLLNMDRHCALAEAPTMAAFAATNTTTLRLTRSVFESRPRLSLLFTALDAA